MRIITISREFGSGGRELGKRLSELLGFDYYDKEIVTEIASKNNLDENYIQNKLTFSHLNATAFHYGHTFSSTLYVHDNNTHLLSEQRKIIENIAKKGKDFVIIGRNSDVLLKEYSPFNVFVTADMDEKIKRCLARADKNENLTVKQIRKKIIKIDKARKQARYMITEKHWGHKNSYHLIVNTTEWDIENLACSLAQTIKSYFEKVEEHE